MSVNVELHDLSATVGQNDHDIEKADDGAKTTANTSIGAMLQSNFVGSFGRSATYLTSADHALRDRRLADLHAEREKLVVYVRGSQQKVSAVHMAKWLTYLAIYSRTAGPRAYRPSKWNPTEPRAELTKQTEEPQPAEPGP